jgi:pantetheine-phosphate adenylyltransferase
MSTGPIALYPGSFDPVTRGHLDLIARAARLFARLHVGVLENPSKTPLFSAAERVALLEAETRGIGNVEVLSFGGLAVDAALKVGAAWIVRGLRSEADAAHEISMARSNRLCGAREVETVFIPASANVAFISSTLVREIVAQGGKLAPFVTPAVEKALRAKAT